MYLSTGNEPHLRQMMKIAELRGDPMSQFQNALYLGDTEERIRLLQDVNQRKYGDPYTKSPTKPFFAVAIIVPLAYMTAKANGLTERAEAILAAAGKTEEDINLSSVSLNPSISRPTAITQLEDPNWPLLTVSKSYFETAFTNSVDDGSNNLATGPTFKFDDSVDTMGEIGGEWGADDDVLDLAGGKSNMNGDDLFDAGDQEPLDFGGEEEDGGGWGLDDDDIKGDIDAEISRVAAKESAEFVPPTSGSSESAQWIQNSPLAADHIAAGSFESAMKVSRYTKKKAMD